MPRQLPRQLPHSLIPPYLLDRLAQHAGPPVSVHAAHTLLIDREQRGQRESTGTLRPGAASAPPMRQARAGSPERAIHDAKNTMVLPGTLVRAEGRPGNGDIAVDEAYDHLGATYRLFHEVYRRDSIDGAGLPLTGTVHYGVAYDNAFWNGTQMVFGDGDGEVMNRFTIAVDIIGHELTHGVIDHEAGLLYRGQSGALNESVCDVFGALVKQYALGQSARAADWLVGAGLFTAAVNARALRSMAEPGTAYDDPLLGKDPQPAHMRDFVATEQDNGGVHINSGIPNRAFHLAAIALGGNAWETVGRVWYDTLCDRRLRRDADFASFAQLTLAVASATHGPGSATSQAIGSAWEAVGVASWG